MAPEIYLHLDLTESYLMTIVTSVLDMPVVTTQSYRSLRAWRRAHKFSQQRAAKMLGLSQSHYSKLERRTTALPGYRAKFVNRKTGVPLEVLVLTAA